MDMGKRTVTEVPGLGTKNERHFSTQHSAVNRDDDDVAQRNKINVGCHRNVMIVSTFLSPHFAGLAAKFPNNVLTFVLQTSDKFYYMSYI